ncbi:unnamed protein product [Phaeothamnion confervicola]
MLLQAAIRGFASAPGTTMIAPLGVALTRRLSSVAMKVAEPTVKRRSSREEVVEQARSVGHKPTIRYALDVLGAQKSLLERISLEDYKKIDQRLEGSIAVHMRHSVAHFEAVLSSLSAPIDDSDVDYDARPHFDENMEQSPESAWERVCRVKDAVKALDDDALSRPAVAKFMVSHDGHKETFATTVGRELAFAAHHGVHHNAIMAWIARDLGYHLGDDFGLNFATIRHKMDEGEL